MELGLGQKYTLGIENISIPNTPSSFDVIQIAPASNVPVLLEHIIATANATSAAILRLQLVFRSTASTGGTAVTPKNTSPAGPAASSTITYNNVSTTGTLVSNSSSEASEWNEFAPYEFDVRPGGLLLNPSQFLCLYVPAAPGSAFYASFRLEFVEVK